MNTAPQPETGPEFPQFRFVEFSKTRQMRGIESARIEVTHAEGDFDELWMSAGDLNDSIRLFGKHEALTEALKAYAQGGRG